METLTGKLSGTRRNFIRGVAAAGASTMAASALQKAGALDAFVETAHAARRTPFSDFEAIAASSADVFEVPPGYRADIIIKFGDRFSDCSGNRYTYGYNNDFLAFFPLDRKGDEGLLFVNHEYTAPFYLHGYKPEGATPTPKKKSRAQIDMERATIGNSVVHIRRRGHGPWEVVSPSRYNRRIYAGRMPELPGFEHSEFLLTGPLASDPRLGAGSGRIWGSLGNCSGGTTPWGTAISCEENFDGYGLPLPAAVARTSSTAGPTRPTTASPAIPSTTRAAATAPTGPTTATTAGSASTTHTTRRSCRASTRRSAASGTRTRASARCPARSS